MQRDLRDIAHPVVLFSTQSLHREGSSHWPVEFCKRPQQNAASTIRSLLQGLGFEKIDFDERQCLGRVKRRLSTSILSRRKR